MSIAYAPMRNRSLLPIGVFAHNEEKIIGPLLESVTHQRPAGDLTTVVFVLANDCRDQTEGIVKTLSRQDDRIRLISLDRKGKAYALEDFKKSLSQLRMEGYQFDNVLLMDADILFPNNDVFENLSNTMEKNPEMYAVVANPMPESVINDKLDFVSVLYRAKFKFQEYHRISSFSGMCYIIRWKILEGLSIPGYIMAEDRFLAEKLKRRFIRSRNISIVYKVVNSLSTEIKRNLRHCIANRQLEKMYGSELLKPISSITPIKKGREEGNVFGFIMVFMKLPWQEKMAILLFGFISFLNNIRAYVFLKNIKQDDLIKKHWNTIR